MMPEWTRDEMAKALASYRDGEFARLVTFCVALAVERHPEELRTAIGQVFDLAAVEALTRRAMASAQAALSHAADARETLGQIAKDLESLGRQLDGLRYDVERLDRTRTLKLAAANRPPAARSGK